MNTPQLSRNIVSSLSKGFLWGRREHAFRSKARERRRQGAHHLGRVLPPPGATTDGGWPGRLRSLQPPESDLDLITGARHPGYRFPFPGPGPAAVRPIKAVPWSSMTASLTACSNATSAVSDFVSLGSPAALQNDQRLGRSGHRTALRGLCCTGSRGNLGDRVSRFTHTTNRG